jgi:hypothetical protein
MAAVAVAASAEAQIPAAIDAAVVAGATSSEETAVELRTEAEASAVEVDVQRAEAQIPVEVAALVAALALRAEAVAQIPAAVAEQEPLRTDCNAAALQVPLLHWSRLWDQNVVRTGRSASVHGFDRSIDQTDCLIAAVCMRHHRDQLWLEPRKDRLGTPSSALCLLHARRSCSKVSVQRLVKCEQ